MEAMPLTHLAATLLCALALGGTVVYAAVFSAILSDGSLSDARAPHVRDPSHLYYSVLIVLSGVAAILLWSRSEASVLTVIAVLFAFTRFAMMPRIDRAREASRAGSAEETETFAHLGNLNSVVHLAQMAALTTVFLRLLLV